MPQSARTRWVDYLKSFIIVLVVAHHSALAYTTFSVFNPEAYILSTNPIVDLKRWGGLDLFVSFNDIFFMFLMFFISGLFVVKSLQRKGPSRFLKDRIKRLLLPFILGGTALMLIAYFPSYFVAHHDLNIGRYIQDFFTVESWPVGPPWFIWVLFLFNLLMVILYPGCKEHFNKCAIWLASLQKKPGIFYLLLFLTTWILFAPLALQAGAGRWSGFGPFDFQTSRIVAYFGYFIFGALVGCSNFNSELFSLNAPLIRKDKFWIVVALLIFFVITLNTQRHLLEGLVIKGYISENTAWMSYFTLFAASCTASCIACISVFRKNVQKAYRWWDSLSANAYLIYLIHYVFVIWLQFILLPVHLPAFFKFLIVFLLSLVLSWTSSHLVRQNKLFRKYL